MRLHLEFLEGPLKGQRITLFERTSLGRGPNGISVPDPKLSGSHMFFDIDPETQLWSSVDDGSRNGVWVNGHRELKAQLRNGDKIQVGESTILCRTSGEKVRSAPVSVEDWVQKIASRFVDRSNTKKEIKPEMRLRAVQGVQCGETWNIFYGPRVAGKESLDICLYEQEAPTDAFEIRVKGHYAYFHTQHEDSVKINNAARKMKQFEPGDVISVGETQLIAEFDEGHGFNTKK